MATKKNSKNIEDCYATFNASNIYISEDITLNDVIKRLNKSTIGGSENSNINELKNHKIIYENENYKHTKKNKCTVCKTTTNSKDGIKIYEINKVKVLDTCSECLNDKMHEIEIKNLDEEIIFLLNKKRKR